jgi:hypothetical protein
MTNIKDFTITASKLDGSHYNIAHIYDILFENSPVETIINWVEDNYNGNCFFVYKFNDKYYAAHDSWGSCDGCDNALNCYDFDGNVDLIEMQKNINRIINDLLEFDSIDELKKYYLEHTLEFNSGSYGRFLHPEPWELLKNL